MNSQPTQPDPNRSRRVVLIHGLAAHRILMWPLAWYLNRHGFVATTFGYRSWFWSVERHANLFRQHLERLEQDAEIESFDIVTHSMGGIVTRQAILGDGFSALTKLRRVVQLGPPNLGSPAARRLGYVLPFCKTLRQISDRPESFVRNLPMPDSGEFGIIAAQYDRVVPENNTHLSTEIDHVSIFSGHNGLLVRPKALKQVVEFLSHGKFSR